MKPENLIPPYRKEEQRTIIHDRVWYLPTKPTTQSDFVFPGWSHPDLFGNNLPVIVEYCSGNGAWIADKAAKEPGFNWIAVEMKFERVKKIWSKIKNFGLNNLIVVCGEANRVTSTYFPEQSVSGVYINFPDPWPKKRHAKNRLIQPVFMDQVSRVLIENKNLTFVTDDVPYSEWFIEVLNAHPHFTSLHPDPYFLTEESGYGTSYFDQLWRSKGRSIRYHSYQKRMP